MLCFLKVRCKPSRCKLRCLSAQEEHGLSFPGGCCEPPCLGGRLLLLFLSPIGVRPRSPVSVLLSPGATCLPNTLCALGGRGGRPRSPPVTYAPCKIDVRRCTGFFDANGLLVFTVFGGTERECCGPLVHIPFVLSLAERPSASKDFTRCIKLATLTQLTCTGFIPVPLCLNRQPRTPLPFISTARD
jgi:hypothetical protein